MQKRSRRPHGIRSRKISVSISEEDLELLSARAQRQYGGNISAVVHDMVAALRREQAADELLEMIGGEHVTEEQMQGIRDEIAAMPLKRRRRHTAA